MNFNNNINNMNNLPPNKKESGTEYNITENNNNNNNEQEIGNDDYNNIISFDNNNNNINNLNQNVVQFEEEEFEEENESSNNNNVNSSYSNNLPKQLIPTENFSQQVDFLFNPKNPEWETVPIQNNKNIIIEKKIKNNKENNINFKNNKTKNKKPKSKNKFRGGFVKNKLIKKKLENRPEFDLCTKIEPTPKKNNLSLFYGTKGDSKYEKQVKIRQQKIEQYEEDFLRQKEIYKAKRKREDFELKKNYMNQKFKTSSNFYSKKNDKDDFTKQINYMTKISYPNTNLRNYECNPQKYDIIIHSLLSEISQIKLQREKENKAFEEQIRKLQSDYSIRKRPKSGIKNYRKNNNNNPCNNIICKNIKNYFDKNNKNNKRPLTVNKYHNTKHKKKENEIPIPSSKNNTNSSTKNNYYKNTKEKIIEKLKDIELQKQNKLKEIMDLQQNNSYNNNINKNKMNNNKISNITPKITNSVQNISNISNSPNIILAGPQYLNFSPSINTNILNFQDKAQILIELNNNIAQFTSGIPKLINKVNEAVNKIYANTENPIKKAINNHPFVIMASKATYQTIKSNIDVIVESMIDDLILEIKSELNDIDEKEKKYILMNNFRKTQIKLNAIKQDEIITLKKYSN